MEAEDSRAGFAGVFMGGSGWASLIPARPREPLTRHVVTTNMAPMHP